MTVDQRNDEFLAHLNLIYFTINRNRPLLSKLRMDAEDMAQELAVCLLRAVETFDPSKGRKAVNYYLDSLQYGVLGINRAQALPCRVANLTARPLVFIGDDGDETEMEIPYNEDMTALYVGEFLSLLSERERTTLNRVINGDRITDKRQKGYMGLIKKKATRFCAAGGI